MGDSVSIGLGVCKERVVFIFVRKNSWLLTFFREGGNVGRWRIPKQLLLGFGLMALLVLLGHALHAFLTSFDTITEV